MSGRTKQKIETYSFNFRSLWQQHSIFYTDSLMHSTRYYYKKIRSFGWFWKSMCFVGRCRDKNSQCRMTDVGVWERNPQPPAGGKRVFAQSLQSWRFLQFFNENNTFLGIFRFKFLLKNSFLISSIIQNG